LWSCWCSLKRVLKEWSVCPMYLLLHVVCTCQLICNTLVVYVGVLDVVS
jgi:hypothetical protein